MTNQPTGQNTPEHHHYADGGYRPKCPRCRMEYAAPELLEALKALAQMHDDACFICGADDYDKANERLRKAHAAIKSATGQG